jgi:hypothetical protein
MWLGDGSSVMNHISVHEDDREVADHLCACGVEAEFRLPTWRYGKIANIVIDPTFRTRTDTGAPASARFRSPFIARSRMLDVLGNKHVPHQYVRASREQRLELVRGFMDSGGSIVTCGKRCEFSNSDPKLIGSFVELLRSLGYKPGIYWTPARRKVFREGREPSDIRRGAAALSGRSLETCERDASVDAFCKINEQKHTFARLRYIKEDGLPAFYSAKFFVRAGGAIYLVETKAQGQLTSPNVLRIRKAAVAWCGRINGLPAAQRSGSEWHYVLLGESTFYGWRDKSGSVADLLAYARLRPVEERQQGNFAF